jgi:hypothetical protein
MEKSIFRSLCVLVVSRDVPCFELLVARGLFSSNWFFFYDLIFSTDLKTPLSLGCACWSSALVLSSLLACVARAPSELLTIFFYTWERCVRCRSSLGLRSLCAWRLSELGLISWGAPPCSGLLPSDRRELSPFSHLDPVPCALLSALRLERLRPNSFHCLLSTADCSSRLLWSALGYSVCPPCCLTFGLGVIVCLPVEQPTQLSVFSLSYTSNCLRLIFLIGESCCRLKPL